MTFMRKTVNYEHDLPDDMVTLNNTALTILAALWDAHKRGQTLSWRGLQRITGLSPNGVSFHLKRMRRLELVTWDYDPAQGRHQKSKTLRASCRFLFPSAEDLLAHVNKEKPHETP